MSNRSQKASKTIVCHSFPAWDTPYVKSTIELMTRLSKDHRVIFIDYHYTMKDVLRNPYTPKDRVLGKAPRVRNIQTEYGEIEVVSSPPVIPTTWINNPILFKLVTKINAMKIGKFIKKLKRDLFIKDFVLVNAFNPIYGLYTLKYWKPNKSIYYCYDEISGTQWSGKHGPKFEERFAKKVDLVVTTSKKLQEDKSELNENCELVPNGVNLDIFHSAPEHHEKSYSIGYVGAVDDRVDFELLEKLTKTFPKYRFDFFGPVKTIIPAKLKDKIFFHGSVDQQALPEKISIMDLCLIPFVKNELTEAIYPLKINEYLAMGKPVVTTDFSDLSDFEKLVGIGTDHNDFLDQVRKQLRYDSRIKAHKRMMFASGNSWNERTNTFSDLLSA